MTLLKYENRTLVVFEREDADGYYFGVYLSGPFQLGMFHNYYDGPHHALWLGWLSFGWSPRRWCEKCAPRRST